MKFKKGDKVRILLSATIVGVESEDVGKTGVISYMVSCPDSNYGITVQMGDICKIRGKICRWTVGYDMIELCPVKGQQLEFEFMD